MYVIAFFFVVMGARRKFRYGKTKQRWMVRHIGGFVPFRCSALLGWLVISLLQVQRALAMLEDMRQKQLTPDLQSAWALGGEILSYWQSGRGRSVCASRLQSLRRLAGFIFGFVSLPGACKPKEWEDAIHILRTLMVKANIVPDAQSFEHVAAACEEGHDARCELGYALMQARQLCSASFCTSFAKEWQKSLDLFKEISELGLSASSVGHNYALSACRQGKRWQHGFEIMEMMKERINSCLVCLGSFRLTHKIHLASVSGERFRARLPHQDGPRGSVTWPG